MVDKNSRTPLYIQIYEEILGEIKNKTFSEGDILPSEKDFSERFNVERQTVRRALAILVNEELVEKRQGIGSLVRNHQPSGNTGTLIGQTKGTEVTNNQLFFLLPKTQHGFDRITEPFNSQLFSAMDSECRKSGYLLTYIVIDSISNIEQIAELAKGIFLVSIHPPHIYENIWNVSIPVISINHEAENMVSLVEDSVAGVYKATTHLIEKGHRDIAFINGPEEYDTSKQRQMGWIKALEESNINYREQPYVIGDWTFNGGMDGMNRILESSKPTALVAANDMMAYGAIESASVSGFKVPRDFSVVGFDNIDQCNYMKPHLTSISPDIKLMAELALRHIQMETGIKKHRAYKIVVPTSLVLRNSVHAI